MMISSTSYLTRLKQCIPEDNRSWMLNALKHDPVIWKMILDGHAQELLESEECHPADLNPAVLLLCTLGYQTTPDSLRSEPMQSFSEADAFEETETMSKSKLVAIVRSALVMRENRLMLGSWNGLAWDLVNAQPTALACLFGIISDTQDMLATILETGGGITSLEHRVNQALHALLSNPQAPDDRYDFLRTLLENIHNNLQLPFIRRLADLYPEMASRLAHDMIANPTPDFNDDAYFADVQWAEIESLNKEIQIHQIAGLSEEIVTLLEATIQSSSLFQARLSARIARIAAQTGDTNKALDAWERACKFAPQSVNLRSEYALALLDAGRSADAQSHLSATNGDHTHPLPCLARARLATERGNVSEAKREAGLALERMLESTLDRHEATNDLYTVATQLTSLLLQLNQPALATQTAQLAVEWRPNDVYAHALFARSLCASGNLDSSILFTQIAIMMDPDRLDLQRELAERLELAEEWSSAYNEWKEIIDKSEHQDRKDQHALAVCALKSGQPDRCIEICEDLLELNPEDGIAHARMGEARATKGEAQSAIEHLHHAIQLAPDQAIPWLALAHFYRDAGQPKKASETLRSGTYAAPSSPEIHLALGTLHLDQGAPTQALNDLRQANELAETMDQSLTTAQHSYRHTHTKSMISLRLGQTLNQLGHTAEAGQVLRTAYNNAPSHPEIALGYARLLIAQGEIRSALAPLETVIKAESNNISPYLDYARCLLTLHKEKACDVNIEQGLQALRKALEIQPDHKEAFGLLGETLLACGEPADALEAFNKAITSDLIQDPHWQVRLSIGLGQAALQMGEAETAVASLREANQVDPLNPDIQRYLSEAYQAAGLVEDAYQAARAALLMAPTEIDTLIWFANQALDLQSNSNSSLPDAHRETINALNRARQLSPTRVDLIIKMAQVQVQIGDKEAALETLRELVSTEEQGDCMQGSVNDYYHASKELMMLGDPSSAAACLEKALQGTPTQDTNSSPALLTLLTDLALARYHSGDIHAALLALDQAITIAPEEPNLYLIRANLLIEMQQFRPDEVTDSEVLLCLETATKLNPDDVILQYRVAEVHRAAGNLHAAYAHIEHMLEVCGENDPMRVRGLALAAELARVTLDFNKARELLEYNLPEFDSPSEAAQAGALVHHCLLSEIALDLGEDYLAVTELGKAMEIDPEDLRVLILQARMSYRRNDNLAALDLLTSTIESLGEITATSPTLVRALAVAALELNMWDEAMRLCEILIERAPQESLAFFTLAQALVLRAEHQQIYQIMDVIKRAPGSEALSEETHLRLESALEESEKLASSFTGDLPAGTKEQLRLWQLRGRAVFHPSQQSEEALSSLPNSPDVISARLACLRQTGDLSKAGLVARDFPKNPLILLQLALALMDEKPRQGMAAAHAAADALSDAPLTYHSRSDYRNKDIVPLVQALLARLYHRSGNRIGDHANAIQAIQNALNYWPDEPRWHILAAEIYAGSSDHSDLVDIDAAISHLEMAIDLDPSYIPPYLPLARLYLKHGVVDKAVRLCEKASRIDPEDGELRLMLANTLRVQGDLERAAVFAEQASDLMPDHVDPILLRGEIALQAGDPKEAQRCAQSILSIIPDDTTGLLLMVKALQALDRSGEALAMIEKSTQASPQSLPLLIERVRLLKQVHDIDTALFAVQELSDEFPNRTEVLSLMAEVLAQTGDQEGAIRVAQRALRAGDGSAELSPEEQAHLHLMLGKLLRQTGQLDQAIYHLNESVQHSPGIVDAHLELGQAHKERRNHSQALQAYQQAINAAPDDYRPYFQVGITLRDSKDYIGAEKMLRRAAELAPDDPGVHRLLAAVVALNLVHNRRENVSDLQAQ